MTTRDALARTLPNKLKVTGSYLNSLRGAYLDVHVVGPSGAVLYSAHRVARDSDCPAGALKAEINKVYEILMDYPAIGKIKDNRLLAPLVKELLRRWYRPFAR